MIICEWFYKHETKKNTWRAIYRHRFEINWRGDYAYVHKCYTFARMELCLIEISIWLF